MFMSSLEVCCQFRRRFLASILIMLSFGMVSEAWGKTNTCAADGCTRTIARTAKYCKEHQNLETQYPDVGGRNDPVEEAMTESESSTNGDYPSVDRPGEEGNPGGNFIKDGSGQTPGGGNDAVAGENKGAIDFGSALLGGLIVLGALAVFFVVKQLRGKCPRCGGKLQSGKCPTCLWPVDVCPVCSGKGSWVPLVDGICPECIPVTGRLGDNVRFVVVGEKKGGFGVVLPAIVRQGNGSWKGGAVLKHTHPVQTLANQYWGDELEARINGILFETSALKYLKLKHYGSAPKCLESGMVRDSSGAGLGWNGPWYVMEKAQGDSLEAWMNAQRGDEERKVFLYAFCKALRELHALTVIHRDIKPQNIFWDGASGKVTFVDFGSAMVPNVANPLEKYPAPVSELWAPSAYTKGGILLNRITQRADFYACAAVFCSVALGIRNLKSYRNTATKEVVADRLKGDLANWAGERIAGLVVDTMIAGYEQAPSHVLDELLMAMKEEWGVGRS